MAESLALGHDKKRLQDKAYPFVANERTFRTSQSNSSTLSSYSHTHLMLFFISLLSFTFGISWAWAAAAILATDFQCCLVNLHSSGARQRWCGVPSSSTIIAVHDVRIVVHLSKNFLIWKVLKRTRQLSLILLRIWAVEHSLYAFLVIVLIFYN